MSWENCEVPNSNNFQVWVIGECLTSGVQVLVQFSQHYCIGSTKVMFDHNFLLFVSNFQLFQLLQHPSFSFICSCSWGGIYESHMFIIV
jgi:hypothetical protein